VKREKQQEQNSSILKTLALAVFVEPERFELSSREGNHRVFYMLSRSLVFEPNQGKDTRVEP